MSLRGWTWYFSLEDGLHRLRGSCCSVTPINIAIALTPSLSLSPSLLLSPSLPPSPSLAISFITSSRPPVPSTPPPPPPPKPSLIPQQPKPQKRKSSSKLPHKTLSSPSQLPSTLLIFSIFLTEQPLCPPQHDTLRMPASQKGKSKKVRKPGIQITLSTPCTT